LIVLRGRGVDLFMNKLEQKALDCALVSIRDAENQMYALNETLKVMPNSKSRDEGFEILKKQQQALNSSKEWITDALNNRP